jgi:hypothetical protein
VCLARATCSSCQAQGRHHGRAACRAAAAARAADLRVAAESGDAHAANALGSCFLLGCGVRESITEANAWYARGAAGGVAGAAANLGLSYMRGRGVAKDYARALDLMLTASAAGDANACACAGFILDRGGHGVVRDGKRSADLTLSAARRGDVLAMANAAVNCAQRVGDSVHGDAAQWARRALEGWRVLRTADVPLPPERVEWLRMAARGEFP